MTNKEQINFVKALIHNVQEDILEKSLIIP
jgi:hypothetical protein